MIEVIPHESGSLTYQWVQQKVENKFVVSIWPGGQRCPLRSHKGQENLIKIVHNMVGCLKNVTYIWHILLISISEFTISMVGIMLAAVHDKLGITISACIDLFLEVIEKLFADGFIVANIYGGLFFSVHVYGSFYSHSVQYSD